jgi:hypothetical protein
VDEEANANEHGQELEGGVDGGAAAPALPQFSELF